MAAGLSRHYGRQNSYEEEARMPRGRQPPAPPPSTKGGSSRHKEREYGQISSGGQGDRELYDQYQHTRSSQQYPQRPKTGYKGRVDTSHYLDNSNYD